LISLTAASSSYGLRNSFGMAFDPFSRHLWLQMNGDDTFDEIQRVGAGLNSGWIQTIGPIARVGEFKQIETTRMPGQLQQLRWPPTKLAGTTAEASSGSSCSPVRTTMTRNSAGAMPSRLPA
jgi:glucose/arabinose dehydrogenase